MSRRNMGQTRRGKPSVNTILRAAVLG